jgi:acetyl esterase/lipase
MTDFLVPVTQEMIEESKEHNARVEALLASVPSVDTVEVAITRRQRATESTWAGPVVLSERATTRTIPGAAGPIGMRLVIPERVDGVFLHFHGGGWTFGSADQQDPVLVGVADALNVAVVSAEYRLAPEHPFPAAPDDCEAVARWLVEHAQSEFGTERLILGGESAGAHLAALTLLRLRDRHHITDAFAGVNLVFGVYDLSMTPSARAWGKRNLVLNTPIMAWFAEMFTPGMTPEGRRSPDVSPMYAELRDLPPALFVVGALDPLLDDSLFMAARWRAAGNESVLRVFPESVHGFVLFPTAITALAFATMLDFGRSVLGTS